MDSSYVTLVIPLAVTLTFLVIASIMLAYFERHQARTERLLYYQKVWTNYFWWNRELIYAMLINYSPNTQAILSEVYSCIDQMYLPPEATMCFKQMVRCQVVVMQNERTAMPHLVEQWKACASRLGVLLMPASPFFGQMLFQSQVDVTLQQMKYLKMANVYHIHVYQQQLLSSVPLLSSMCSGCG